MATIAEFLAAAQSYNDSLNAYNGMMQSYVPFFNKLRNEDPCVVGFAEKLEELDREADSNNAFVTNTLNPVIERYNSILDSLGPFDKRSSEVTNKVQEIRALSRRILALREGVSRQAREDLRAKFQACPTLKDPNATDKPDDTKKDPEEGTKPPEDNLAGKSSDDDNASTYSSPTGNGSAGSMAAADEVYSGATPTTTAGTAGKSNKKTKKTNSALPKRPFNPLSKFSSYTYNLTLYMITPDAYNLFVQTGKRTLRDATGTNYAGVYIVAQSGGINNNVNERPPGMTMDYYIDNLKIKTYTTGPGTGGESNSTKYTFNIIEPNGFSFITKLSNAAKEMIKKSTLVEATDGSGSENGMKQFFVIGIGFSGYNSDGSVAKASEIFATDTFTTADGLIYERFFDITFTKLTFNLDGNMVVYSVESSQVATEEALGTKRGKLFERGIARGETVEEALTGDGGIIPYINEQQKLMYDKGLIKKPYQYAIRWVNDQRVNNIKNAKLITKDDIKSQYVSKLGMIPMTNLKSVNQVNDAKAVNSSAGNGKVKELTFEPNAMLGGVIKKIIQSSTYLADALLALSQSQPEPESANNGEDDEAIEQSPTRSVAWYSLGSEVECLGWDKQRNDWSYKITYVIAPFNTPFTSSMVAGKTGDYYGPHKRYKYWFTGKNTEIIKYSQAMNTAWYEAEAGVKDGTTAPQGPPKSIERVPGDRQGSLGQGLDQQNSYLNSLFSPADWVNAKIEILGDPDYLMYDTPGSLNEVYNQFYASNSDLTINPNGGQVFIEIDFVEGVDYNHTINGTLENWGGYYDNGLMTLNNSLLFWNYSKIVKERVGGIEGISYMVRTVDSTFSKGKFTQELELNINTFDNIKEDPDNPGEQANQREVDTGDETVRLAARYPANQSDKKTTNSANNSISPPTTPAGSTTPGGPPATVPTPNGRADDDGSNARDQLLARQRPNDTPPASASVNDRLRVAFGLEQGRESESLINRFRARVGIPVGGTNPGGG